MHLNNSLTTCENKTYMLYNFYMLIECARDRTAYFARGIIGRLFHCTDMGDYHTVQCNGSVCFCADRKTGKMLDSQNGGIHISAKDKLKC